jgi:hypothetical protein
MNIIIHNTYFFVVDYGEYSDICYQIALRINSARPS